MSNHARGKRRDQHHFNRRVTTGRRAALEFDQARRDAEAYAALQHLGEGQVGHA